MLLLCSGSPRPLFCQGNFLWCSEPYQHALYLAPACLYDPVSVKWDTNKALYELKGQSRDVFYSWQEERTTEIHYAGTYKCRYIAEISVEEYRRVAPNVSRMSDLTSGDTEDI